MKILVNVFHPHLQDQSRVNNRWVQELKKYEDITINIEKSASACLAHITNPELKPKIRFQKLLAEMEAAGTKLETW